MIELCKAKPWFEKKSYLGEFDESDGEIEVADDND